MKIERTGAAMIEQLMERMDAISREHPALYQCPPNLLSLADELQEMADKLRAEAYLIVTPPEAP